MKKLIVFFLGIAFIWVSCKKPEEFPNIPDLEFKSLSFFTDSNGMPLFELKATFNDGDGDIGYNSGDFNDKNSPYYSNFVVTIERLKNGNWTDTIRYHLLGNPLDTLSPFPYSTRIPYLTPAGKNKGLKGEIDKIDNLPLGLNDTIRFKAFLYDRSLHKSNLIETPAYFIQTK